MKVWKLEEYCMYFLIFKLNSWGKRSAEAEGDLFSGYFGGTPSRAGACACPRKTDSLVTFLPGQESDPPEGPEPSTSVVRVGLCRRLTKVIYLSVRWADTTIMHYAFAAGRQENGGNSCTLRVLSVMSVRQHQDLI